MRYEVDYTVSYEDSMPIVADNVDEAEERTLFFAKEDLKDFAPGYVNIKVNTIREIVD